MIKIEMIDTESKKEVEEFIDFHYDLYTGTPNWTPPFKADLRTMLNRKKHPFYEHSDGDFFLAKKEGKTVGRIGVLVNKPFNEYHNKTKAQFYFFDSIDDQEVADALFEAAAEWARDRGLTELVGPKGLSAFDGYGILVEGFEHHQMMNTMNYNFPYYQKLFETAGFVKENDFVSCYLDPNTFKLPEKMELIAEKVLAKGKYKIKTFSNKKEIMKWALQIGKAYNDTFINNWEYYPLSTREIAYVKENILAFADPKLIKLITYEDKIIGFLLGFPDVSQAMLRSKGGLTPWGIIDLMREMKKTKWISLNGLGVLPDYQGTGGNVLMYVEMLKTIKDYGFEHAELTQMADTATRVRSDLVTIGVQVYKVHRIFSKVF